MRHVVLGRGRVLPGILAMVVACAACERDGMTTAGAGGGQGPASRSAVVSELTAIAERDRVPGFAVAVVGPDGITQAEGFGLADVAEGMPVTTDTLFHIGSTHKAVNAFLVATLVDDGAIGWDESVADATGVPLDPDISMRHLLTMTSGVPAAAEDELPDAVAQQSLVDDAVFDAFAGADPSRPPGEAFEYSNVSAAAAGYAAVAAEDPGATNLHQGYLDQVEERVLDPLGMTGSTLLATQARASGDLARSYELYGDELVELESEDVDLDLLAPAGSLKSSVTDMGHFLQVLLNDGIAPDGTRVVSPESIQTMWSPELDGYAMGWEADAVDGVDYLAHEGSYDGFLSLIMVIPDREVGLVVLTNSEDAAGPLVAAAPALFVASTG